MKELKTVIIEDDESNLSELQLLLEPHKNINLLGNAGDVKSAVELINRKKPDLVFLDIDLPGGSGFDVIENTRDNRYKVIFTTAHEEYAVRAFEFSALHYLLKPINIDKLNEAINRYSDKSESDLDERFKILKESLLEKPQKIMLQTNDGREFANIADIVRFEAVGGYSNVFFNDSRNPMLITRTLTYLHDLLLDMDFARPHNSHLINLKYVKKYVRRGKGHLTLKDNTLIPITDTYRTNFSEAIEKFARA